MPPRMRPALCALVAVLSYVVVPGAAADLADETELAERYAPVVRLVEQVEECGPGEPYEPMDVDLLFDEPTVALRGPWGGGDLIEVGPSASDLARGLYEYHLDFPGNALDPGCGYERWARRLTDGEEPAVYAHVATDPGHPGRLALQYWLFYPYNDWNNLHEGDWENIQLIFDAENASQALSREPVSVGYSQHEGSEQALWGEDKLELVGGTRPVVYPAAGSHANFFGEGLYLGSSAAQGVGCDDTTGPTVALDPVVQTIPSDPEAARAAHPWIAFEGRWGELQEAFFNGPTGPNLKSSWTEPISVSAGWRDRSYAVPAGGALGTGATDFFCDAVAGGSRALQRVLRSGAPLLLALGALLALLLYAGSRATWRPSAPLRVARRRTWGQILSASTRTYVRRFPLLVGIGLLLLPTAVVITLLQSLVLWLAGAAGVEVQGEAGGVLVLVVVAIGTALTLLGFALVQAAVACALAELDAGRPIDAIRAYRLALRKAGPLLSAVLLAVVAWMLLSSTLILVPVAIWLAVRVALLAQVVELEGVGSLAALRRSSQLVRHNWWKVGSLVVAAAAVVLVTGPLLGSLLIVVTDVPLVVLNLVSGIVYALALPFVALTTSYVYFDVRTRAELEPPQHAPTELPAEIALAD